MKELLRDETGDTLGLRDGEETAVGESERLHRDRLPRRVKNFSLTFLASSSISKFFFLSSSVILISGKLSCTRSITCPLLSTEIREPVEEEDDRDWRPDLKEGLCGWFLSRQFPS